MDLACGFLFMFAMEKDTDRIGGGLCVHAEYNLEDIIFTLPSMSVIFLI